MHSIHELIASPAAISFCMKFQFVDILCTLRLIYPVFTPFEIIVLHFYIMVAGTVNQVFFLNSVPMDEEEKVVLDYSSDKLMTDGSFRQSILSSIASAGNAIEELYGTPQDIEGVVKDGKIYVVQTRPQV